MVGVDMHVGPILSKMGALNRNQAIAKAITNKLIDVDDDGHAEYMSAKLNATRRAHRVEALGAAAGITQQVVATVEDRFLARQLSVLVGISSDRYRSVGLNPQPH